LCRGSLTYKQTVHAEDNRLPDTVFKVSIGNDKAFDASVKIQTQERSWDAFPGISLLTLPAGPLGVPVSFPVPNASSTNCVDAAATALAAGGVPLESPDHTPFTPAGLEQELYDVIGHELLGKWTVVVVPVKELGQP
jgi:ribulose kinase